MDKDFEIVAGLEAQERELRLDGSETASNLKAARADEKKWREQVEVYGQGQHRGALKEVRETIAALEADAKANAEELASVTAQIGAIQRRAEFVDGLKLKHSLTGAQAQKLKAKLEEGMSEKDARALAGKWAPKTDAERHQARLDDLAAGGAPPVVETPEEQAQERAHTFTAYSIAQQYGLSEEQHARVLSSLKNGSLTPNAARQYALELYQTRSNSPAPSPTPEAPKYAFQGPNDVAW